MADKKKTDKTAAKAPDSKGKSAESGLGTVVLRNDFYRDGYRSMLKLAVIQSCIILLLLGAMYFVIHAHQPENKYFATTEEGRLIPILSLDQPNLSSSALTSWVAQASTEVMTFGHNDYRRRLQEASRNFTRRGWESFTKALEDAKTIESITTNQQVISAAPYGAPIVLQEGMVGGRYQWIVQFPLGLTFQSGSKRHNATYLIKAVIVRVPRLESPNGVGIEQWIASAR